MDNGEEFRDMHNVRFNILLSVFMVATLMVGLAACSSDSPPINSVTAVTGAVNTPSGPDSYAVVDCLLPGQIRQLGTHMTYVTARRPARTTAEQCAIRGGEYVVRDRADYGTSLKIWLGEAQNGSAEAQYYTGTLYEEGASGSPDYRQAAEWYRKAAEQGDKRAMISLGRLYEQGLGVPKDPEQAFTWFAKASGLTENTLALLTNKQASDVQVGTRVRELEDALAAKDQEINQLESQLQERQRLAANERRMSQDAEQRYQTARAELAQLRAKSDQSEAIAKADARVEQLQEEMDRAKRELDARNTDIVKLQQKIASVEANAIDLGFDGPSLEVIDPPLARTRGGPANTAELAVPVNTGIHHSVTGRVLAPAGLRTLMVNGEKVKAKDDGVFTTTLRALRSASDELPVQILAVDMQNKRATLKFILKAKDAITADFQMPALNVSDFGHYHALVIGNDQYSHWPKLMNAISDATAIANVLNKQYAFTVTLLRDADRDQIMNILDRYTKELTEKDNLLIYYAGHGYLEQTIDRGYWIPVNAETDGRSKWIPLPNVIDQLQLIPAKHVMVVADSCFSGKLTRSLSLAQVKAGLTDKERFEVLKELAQERVRTAMSSGGVKPVLDAGGSGHSVFAEAFLGVLEDNMMILEARRLFDAVHARVMNNSREMGATQIPTYDPINMAGHESIGDFIFVPKSQS